MMEDIQKKLEDVSFSGNKVVLEKLVNYPVAIGGVLTGRYLIQRKLGYGNFSTVWQCKDLKTGSVVAIKVIKSGGQDTASAKWEVRVHKLIQDVGHRNKNDPNLRRIVKFRNWFTVSRVNGAGPAEHRCLVFESLGKSVARRTFGIPMVKRITRQVLEGLVYLHCKCNIMHGDIKPENVLVSAPERCENGSSGEGSPVSFEVLHTTEDSEINIKLADFGNALRCIGTNFKHFQHTIQTRAYRCPEIIIGSSFNCTADVWSVACLAFELATGSYLFNPCKCTSKLADHDACHLALITGLLGHFPVDQALAGKYSKELFDPEGELLYTKTRDLVQWSISQRLTEFFGWAIDDAVKFEEFLLMLLDLDPKVRPTAAQCLTFMWLNV